MRPDVETAIARVIALRGRLAEQPDGVSLQKVEDELCVGYAHALAGDAWLSQTEEHMQALLLHAPLDQRREATALAVEHADFQSSVVALRRELAALRQEHDRLRADARAGARAGA